MRDNLLEEISDLSEAPEELQNKVALALTEDILERYDNSEYHDTDIIEAVLLNNGYKII